MALEVVILAAGCGTRMHSSIPKVLHCLAGKPMLEHVIDTAKALNPDNIHVIYGHQGQRVREALSHQNVNWIYQEQQLGTGHAVSQALPDIGEDANVLVLYGDVPLISASLLEKLLNKTVHEGIGIISAEVCEPQGLGRIVRDSSGNIRAIVEHKDASDAQLLIKEINSGILTVHVRDLRNWLPKLDNSNTQGEYYLTDLIKLAVTDKHSVIAVLAACEEEVRGVNDRQQLAALERYYQRQAAKQLLLQGVCVRDPERFDLRGSLQAEQDVEIDINVLIEGDVTIGRNSYIGPNVVLKNAIIGEGVTIHANSVVEGSTVDAKAIVGPFARIRPGTHLKASAKIGNFVETKKAVIGEGSKVNHLSYIGDADVGHSVNIGAGTITCNYDGVNKYKTKIEDNVFVGSSVQLVAPVILEKGATIGAGSVITRDAPSDQLTIARSKQKTIRGWRRPEKPLPS